MYLDRLKRLMSKPGGRLLEVGCGTGDFLVQARARGFEVHGIEYSSAAAATANQRLGAGTVNTGTLESARLPCENFNAIVACDVIEHVRDPKLFLQRAHACLLPGGLIFIVTPSVDSWSRKWMRKHWMEYKLEHLFYFGEASIRLLFASTGFETGKLHPNHKAVSFDYVYHHFCRFPVPFLTPIICGLHHLVPGRAAHRQWNVAGSGMIAIGHKTLFNKTSNGM
jgi:ubiquinone/menaquinone biosynthesis C-methylase UbiE